MGIVWTFDRRAEEKCQRNSLLLRNRSWDQGYVDPGHGIYKVTLDGRKVEYQDGLGNASEYNGKKYFSGTATTRQGGQTLVRLTGLEEGWHAVTLQLDPKRNDTTRNIGIQVDQFITHGEGSALYTKAELIQAMKNWKDWVG